MVGCLGSTYVSWSAAKPEQGSDHHRDQRVGEQGRDQVCNGPAAGAADAGAASTPQAQLDVDRYHGQAGSAPAVARACISVVHW